MQLWELCCAEIWYRWLSRQTSSSAERESTALSSAATAAECVCLQMQHLSAGICLLLLLLSQVRFRSFLPYQSVWLALYGSGAIAISFPLPPTTSSSSFFSLLLSLSPLPCAFRLLFRPIYSNCQIPRTKTKPLHQLLTFITNRRNQTRRLFEMTMRERRATRPAARAGPRVDQQVSVSHIYIYSCTGFVLIRDTEVPGNSLTACRPISTGRVLSFSRLLPPNPPPLRSCFNHFIAFSQVSRSCQALSLFSLQRLPLALSLHRGARIKCSSRDSSSSFFFLLLLVFTV